MMIFLVVQKEFIKTKEGVYWRDHGWREEDETNLSLGKIISNIQYCWAKSMIDLVLSYGSHQMKKDASGCKVWGYNWFSKTCTGWRNGVQQMKQIWQNSHLANHYADRVIGRYQQTLTNNISMLLLNGWEKKEKLKWKLEEMDEMEEEEYSP